MTKRDYKKDFTIDMLSAVEKPARYTGGEFGSVVKERAEVRIALAFPDVYEVGMSYLGFKILYHILNRMEGVAAERTYAPWVDMEKLMRERGVVLTTLETKQALAECDLVGFTLQYELSYTNILNMLDLGGVTVLAQDRKEDEPFVIVGGPCVFNPEPLADFFDLAVIGEGEETLPELVTVYKKWKAAGRQGGRTGFLQAAAQVSGIYVPSFYAVTYQDDGTVQAVTPNQKVAQPVIYKRAVKDLATVDYPTDPIVPFMSIVHDRIMLEVFRGCSRGCRFCNAGMVYRPVRERKPEQLRQLARQLVDNTGYDEISLFSLSTADYSCLDPLLDGMLKEDFKDERVSVSLPSLRIDSFCIDVAQKVNSVRKSGLTFAPEAGSQRMRDVINKGVTEENLMDAVSAAFANGWKKVKLYFMIGLPYETDADVLAIATLAKKVLYKYKEVTGKGGAMVTVSVANFVPKPYTAFQWAAQDSLAEIKRKDLLLKEAFSRVRGINYQYHESKVSVLEGVFARGDRRLGAALYKAWQQGERFDGWDDCFNFDLWQQVFTDCGLDPHFYADRVRGEQEVFPWEHVSPGVAKAFLANEYRKAKLAQLTHDCRHGACTGCNVCQQLGVAVVDYTGQVPVPAPAAAAPVNLQVVQTAGTPDTTSVAPVTEEVRPQ